MYSRGMFMKEKELRCGNIYDYCDGEDIELNDKNELISFGDGLKVITKDG